MPRRAPTAAPAAISAVPIVTRADPTAVRAVHNTANDADTEVVIAEKPPQAIETAAIITPRVTRVPTIIFNPAERAVEAIVAMDMEPAKPVKAAVPPTPVVR